MRANTVKRIIASAKPALGLFVSSASPLAAETVGHLGFDWVLIDLQHGENNLGNLAAMLTAVSATPAMPFVRVPANDPMLIQRALDLGAYGIVVPMVNSPAEAAAAVRAAKYAPRGERSWGPIRGSLYGGDGYFQEANDETMIFAMLETAEATDLAQQILSTPGIDGCYVGPNDLGISYGLPPASGNAERLQPAAEEAVGRILDSCRATGKIAGMQVYDAAAANRRIQQGFRLVGIGTELRLLSGAARAALQGVER